MYSFGRIQSQASDYRLIQALHIDRCNRTDGSEDLLIHCLKPNQPCAAGLNWLKGLYDITLFSFSSFSDF